MHPNILLIVFDAARADAFEPYGAPAGSSPVVAELARRGTAVPHAYAAGSWTVPSHASMFSGLLPRAAGLSRIAESSPYACAPHLEAVRDRLLAEVLRRAGYETAAISTNAWLLPRSGFDIGFDEFVLVDSQRQAGMAATDTRGRLRWLLEGARARVDDGAAEAGRLLRSWIERPRDKPFFFFVNLVEAHSPYLPPHPFNDLGLMNRIRASSEARKHLTLDGIWQASIKGHDLSDDTLERMRTLYAGSIRSLDRWLGDVLDSLDGAGILKSTHVIVTADHGENLGENGMLGHSFSLDERLIRVPLVHAGPVPLRHGKVESLAALAPLLADSIGLTDHPWHERVPTGDIAISQFDPPTGPDDPRVEVLRDAWSVPEELTPRFTTPLTAASDGRYKLLRGGETEQFFDLLEDPLEKRPRPHSSVPSTAVGRLRTGLTVGDAASMPADTSCGPMPETPSQDELDQLEERMRLLGYM